jgi:hypothetical protein
MWLARAVSCPERGLVVFSGSTKELKARPEYKTSIT